MSSNFNCSYMARSSLSYIPFLAHLASLRPCELLPSLFVRPLTFHILIFSSETTGPIAALVECSLGVPLPKLCLVIPNSNQDGHQAKSRKKGDENFKKSSPLKLLSQSQPNFAEMILGWSPSKIVSGISDLRPRWPPQPNLI